MNPFRRPYPLWLKWLLIPAGCVLGFFIGCTFLALILSKAVIAEFILSMAPKTYLNGVNVMVLGIDQTSDSQRSDTIMVVHLDWQHNHIGVLSVPRDTRVNVPGMGFTKINHAYAKGGVELAKKAVSQLLNVPIEYHVVFHLNGVEEIIDQIGGVKINVQHNMYYVDQAGDLFIDLKKGDQTLNGKQAVQYLRFRHDEKADIGRIQRQQSFLKAVSEQARDALSVGEIPGLIRQLSKNFETDLSIRQIIGLAVQFKQAFANGTIQTGTLPGVPSIIDNISYWKPELQLVDKTVQDVLMGSVQEKSGIVSKIETKDKQASQTDNRRRVTLNELNRVVNQTESSTKELKLLKKPLSIEILNGCGKPGEAQYAAKLLKQLGMKVVRWGNAGTYRYDETLMVDWRGDVEPVLVLARAISIDPSKIIVYDKPSKTIDVTLVLGKDWPEIKARLDGATRGKRR